jgi:hypothetical protein
MISDIRTMMMTTMTMAVNKTLSSKKNRRRLSMSG